MGNYFGQPDPETRMYSRILQERRTELANVTTTRMTVSLREAIRYVNDAELPAPNVAYGLSESLRTGVLRYIITKNYDPVTRYIRVAYFADSDASFDVYMKSFGSKAKDTDKLLPEKTIQDSMLSFAEKIDSRMLTKGVAAEIIWMMYTCLHATLPKRPGRPLFEYLITCFYIDLCQEWERTHILTKGVVLGRVPRIFKDRDLQEQLRVVYIKEHNIVDARYGGTQPPASEAVSVSPFSERQRTLQERLLGPKKPASDPIPRTPHINFEKRRSQLERCLSVPNFKT